jgi:hypothetical protein
MWKPATEAQIAAAINSGDLRENVHLDVKRELTRGDGARTELARDLASFAIDGGALLIGVAEDKEAGTFSLAPFQLGGVAEQIENIAANRVDPPLFVRVDAIPTGADPSTGYIHVEVPPSPSAPHMVDGRYPARGDRTKRRLTDAEVVRLHAARESQDAQISRLLGAWAARDVVPAERRQNGHLYLVAEPLTQHNPRAYERVARAANNTPAFDLVARVENVIPRDFRNFLPSFTSGRHWVRRSEGSAFTTLSPGRPVLPDDQGENYLLDFELHDNGGARILMGRLVDTSRDGSERTIALDGAALGYAFRIVRVAQFVSEEIGYRGAWGFGIRGDGLAGAVSNAVIAQRDYFFASDADPYETDQYEAVTTAHAQEIQDSPATIADRLVARLLHGLGSYDVLRAYVDGGAK